MNFNKKILIFSLIIIGFGFTTPALSEQAQAQPKPSIKERISLIKKMALRYADLAFRMQFGAKKVSPEMESYIRNILVKIGIENPNEVKILQLSKIAMHHNGIGEKNAFAASLGKTTRYIFLNEEWLNSISEAAKEFIITHEAMHLKFDHSAKKMKFLARAGSSIIAIYIMNYILDAKLTQTITLEDGTAGKFISDKNRIILAAAKYLTILPTLIISQNMLRKVSHECEYQADLEAAKAMGNFSGAQELFNIFDAYDEELLSEIPTECYQGMKILKQQDAMTHPSGQHRMQYIKDNFSK